MSDDNAELLAGRRVPATDREAIDLATVAYFRARVAADANADGADNLERVANLAAELAGELKGETPHSRAARLRLVARLVERIKWDDRDTPVYLRDDAVADDLDQLIDGLDMLAKAAIAAHTQPPKNQKKKDLRAAYTVLAEHWRRSRPADRITNGFVNGEPKRGSAVEFLLRALWRIDPGRDRLLPELREIVTKDVADTPGPRRGRKVTE